MSMTIQHDPLSSRIRIINALRRRVLLRILLVPVLARVALFPPQKLQQRIKPAGQQPTCHGPDKVNPKVPRPPSADDRRPQTARGVERPPREVDAYPTTSVQSTHHYHKKKEEGKLTNQLRQKKHRPHRRRRHKPPPMPLHPHHQNHKHQLRRQ